MDKPSSGKNKSSLVYRFQLARLEEWIRDLEEANKIYEEIKKEAEKESSGLAYIMEPVVRERKKKIEDTRGDAGWAGKAVADTAYSLHPSDRLVHDNDLVLLYDPNTLQPRSSFSELALPQTVEWKYTVTIAAKADYDLRLETKGYCPNNILPKYPGKRVLEKDWWTCTIESEVETDDPDQIMIEGESTISSSPISITVDRWGLLSGTTLIHEVNLGDYLIHIHDLICELSRFFWTRE